MYLLSVFRVFHNSFSGVRAMQSRYSSGSILNFHFCTEKKYRKQIWPYKEICTYNNWQYFQ